MKGFARRQICRLGWHDYVERHEHGWPKTRVCRHCGEMAPPPTGVGPPDDQRARTRER